MVKSTLNSYKLRDELSNISKKINEYHKVNSKYYKELKVLKQNNDKKKYKKIVIKIMNINKHLIKCYNYKMKLEIKANKEQIAILKKPFKSKFLKS